MTPAARIAAAISLMDAIIAGEPAERALTRWARDSRFAGSRDRAAVRDLVYDAVRRRRSLGHRGGGDTGRAILLALTLEGDQPPEVFFTGEGHAPGPLTPAEAALAAAPGKPPPQPVALDYPDWLHDELSRSLGADLVAVMQVMQTRAPVDLRVNRLKADLPEARNLLAREHVFAEPIPGIPDALRVIEGARGLAGTRAYRYGMVELQDVSSQMVARLAAPQPGQRVLDFCAGGGGKALALASLMGGKGRIHAHDAFPNRMKDLPERARRAGADIRLCPPEALPDLPPCDLVLADAPCSGSGAWRRNPDGKWRLTPASLARLTQTQAEVLDTAATCTARGGRLVYATCSLLRAENEDAVAGFVSRKPDWAVTDQIRLSPLTAGDGFFVALLARK